MIRSIYLSIIHHVQHLFFRVLTGLFLCLVFSANAQTEPDSSLTLRRDYLLVINTYTSDAPWSNSILDPIRHWTTGNNRAVFVEHLNMLMIDNMTEFRKVETDLFGKYPERAPKAVLLLGNSSLLLRDSIRAHWGDVPIVLCAEEDYVGPDLAYIEKRPVREDERTPLSEVARAYNLTVVQSKVFLKDDLLLMRQLIPGMKRLILIGDGRYINQQLDNDLGNLLADEYPDMEYEFFSSATMSMEELLLRLSRIDAATTGVLFSSWFSKSNYAGSTLLITNSFQVIANVSVPVFALQQAVMYNSGMVGGYFYDQQVFRARLQAILEKVLSGTPARDIPFYIPSEAIPVFNYPVLRRKGFSVDECPADSIFLERPLSFWERNKYFIVFGGSLAFFLLLFLFIYQRYRIRALNVLSEERRQKLEVNRELVKLFEDMPIGYSKGKLVRNPAGEVTDVEITRMNGWFIHRIIGEENPVEGRKLSELFGTDFRVFLRFLHLMDTEQKNITYSQFFPSMGEYLGILITNATLSGYIDVYYVNATDLHRTQQKLNETNHKLAMALDVASIVPWNWDLRSHQILCDINRPMKLKNEESLTDADQLAVPDSHYFAKIHKEDRPVSSGLSGT